MGKLSLVKETAIPKSFTDVLYLTNQGRVAPEIRQLLKQKKLLLSVLSIDRFPEILHRLDLIGTVIIDASDLEIDQQQKVARVLETLEMKDIGTILLNNRIKMPVKSFSLAGPQVRSFALTTTMESFSIDELWVRISVNLAYRKKGSEISVKPAGGHSKKQVTSYSNRLAEQFQMVGRLVDSLSEQLRLAGLVQRDFLPARLPNSSEVRWATSFLPAEWVSGDIYDVVRIDEQHIGFYIADAVGHSLPAALLTIFLKQALVMRQTIENNYRLLSPAEVMSNLNVRMAAQKLSGYQFATCCYCLLNTKTLQLTYSRAGHPYPLLISSDGSIKQLEVRGSLLGIFGQAEYLQHTVQLKRGDKLLLYSDGAESFIGTFDSVTGFSYSEEFEKLARLSVEEMLGGFNQIVKTKETRESEIDDITAVALEIL
ncbi:MAG: PP2C family protein-serine/threonine phosphatase [Planctomycetota bacterium]|jgi:sigma-B regulation protein RsbU (phosphoserine phosphatase)